MWSAKQDLELFAELRTLSQPANFVVGMQIARGFADLGFEEFLVLQGKKILSLFTGKITQLNQEEEHHLFLIYTPDQLVNMINQSGFEIKRLEFCDQRTWKLECAPNDISIEADSLLTGLLRALIAIRKGK